MIGKNHLRISHETMLEAVQYWLDNAFLRYGARDVKAVDICEEADGDFTIELQSVEEKPEQ